MVKLAKQYYFNAKGEKKINCYKLTIPKQILNQTNIKDTEELILISKENKIIIEKRGQNENKQ